MKKLLFIIAIIFTANCFAQKSKGGAAKSGASSSGGGGAPSAQIQTGYSYIIKKGVFMQYIYHKLVKKTVTVPTFIINLKRQSVPVKAGSLIQFPGQDSLLIYVKNAGTMTLPANCIIQLASGVIPSIYSNRNYKIKGGTFKSGVWQALSNDSIMWVTDTASVNYLPRRLRVSITQDSGDLKLNINTNRLWNRKCSEDEWPNLKKGIVEDVERFKIDSITKFVLFKGRRKKSPVEGQHRLRRKGWGKFKIWKERELEKDSMIIDLTYTARHSIRYTVYRSYFHKARELDRLKFEYDSMFEVEIGRYNIHGRNISIYNTPETPIPDVKDEILGDNTTMPGREISYMDSLQNFHLIINKTNFIGDKTYFMRIAYNKIQYGVTTIPFQFRWGYDSKYRTATTATVSATQQINAASLAGTSTLTAFNNAQPNYTVPNIASASINGAIYFGWEFGWTKFFNDPNKTYTGLSIVPAVFIGPTIISLTAANTFTNMPGINNTLTPNSNNTTFSQIGVTTGGSVNANYQNFNLGVFFGWDLPIGANDARNWVYAKKPWLGFGIGYNLGMLISGALTGASQSPK